MRFADIPGHDQIKENLRRMADSGRVPHALLLEGPEGTAKFALARAFAQYLHCENRADGDSCGQCPACRQMQNFRHIDTIYSFPVIKPAAGAAKPVISNDWLAEFCKMLEKHPFMDFDQWLKILGDPKTMPLIYVDEATELVRRLNFTAQSSRFKTVLLWLPERMKEETANKMLKLIEEPYADTVFIMASDNPARILPTIYSRVQRIKVPRYTADRIAQYLATSKKCPGDRAQTIAHDAGGSLNQALRLTGTRKNDANFLDLFARLMRMAYQRNMQGLKAWATEVDKLPREMQVRLMQYCAHMLRENFVYNLHQPGLNTLSAEEENFSRNFSRFVTVRNISQMAQQFDKAATDIAANASGKIVLFDLAVHIFMYLRR